jgi:hypothetical protein
MFLNRLDKHQSPTDYVQTDNDFSIDMYALRAKKHPLARTYSPCMTGHRLQACASQTLRQKGNKKQLKIDFCP